MTKFIRYSFLWINFILTSDIYALAKPDIEKPPIQLAIQYNNAINIKNYLVSEKLDGVRARWNGEYLITRGGNIINAPTWFIKDFPASSLDGELWIARNKFDEVSGIVRRSKPDSEQWKKVTFNVFDLPLSTVSFERRYQKMQGIFSQNISSYINLIEQKNIKSKATLNDWLDDIEIKNGEGLMLHHKDSLYQHNRSKHLLKFKKKYDAEAIVIAHLVGKGKYKNMLGALLMEMPNGIQFKLGSGLSDELRRNPPVIGSIITYQYYGLTKNNKPRFASYLRIRQ